MSVQTPENTPLIDSVSSGFSAVNRRLWIVLVPLLLNIYLWYGPALSLRPVFSAYAAAVTALPQQMEGPFTPQQQAEQLMMYAQWDMRRPLAVLNVIPTLPLWQIARSQDGASSPFPSEVRLLVDEAATNTIVVGSILGVLVAFVLLNIPALLLSAGYLVKLAETVRDERTTWQVWLRRSARAALNVAGVFGVLLAITLLFGLPLGFLAILFFVASPAVGVFAVTVLMLAYFWFTFFTGLAYEAVVMSGVGPLRALHASFHIVRRNVWGMLGLLAISMLVTVGTGMIWTSVAGNTIGLWVALIASAYLGSGLAAARMAFYSERLRRWRLAVNTVPQISKI